MQANRRALPGGRAPLLAAYTDEAGTYELRTAPFQIWHRVVVRLLPLRAGDVVLDVGCGTGVCLPLIRQRVGASGRVIGIDESPQMLAQARRRVGDNGWHNLTLIESPVERAPIPVTADAALFCAVHDILRSSDALRNVFAHLRAGGWRRAAASGPRRG